MPKVTMTVNGRAYQVGCAAGQEDRLRDLAAELDSRACRLAEGTGALSEGLVLVLTGLMLADEVADEHAARLKAEDAAVGQAAVMQQADTDHAATVASLEGRLATAGAELDRLRADLDEAHGALRAAHERLAQRRDDDAGRQETEARVAEAIENLAVRIETVAERLQAP